MIIIILLIPMIASAIALIIGTRRILKAKSCSVWPVADGIVMESYKEKYVNPSSVNGYIPVVKYKYSVNGKEYQSDLVSFSLNQHSGSENVVKEILQRYPKGKSVKVKYNPKNNAESVLEVGLNNTSTFIIIAMSGVFFLGSIYMLILVV